MSDIPENSLPNPENNSHQDLPNREPERPLECSECKRPIRIHYTEIIGNHIVHTSMCSECPELERRLRGIPAESNMESAGNTGIACGECGMSLQALRVGTPLGCSNCYEVFGDVIFNELAASEKISPRIVSNKRTIPLHIGRLPGKAQEMNPSLRLLTLNEELTETLKREDYEQAAWLRDQINALMEKQQGEESENDRK
jgi:protein arginine kinase activator